MWSSLGAVLSDVAGAAGVCAMAVVSEASAAGKAVEQDRDECAQTLKLAIGGSAVGIAKCPLSYEATDYLPP